MAQYKRRDQILQLFTQLLLSSSPTPMSRLTCTPPTKHPQALHIHTARLGPSTHSDSEGLSDNCHSCRHTTSESLISPDSDNAYKETSNARDHPQLAHHKHGCSETTCDAISMAYKKSRSEYVYLFIHHTYTITSLSQNEP